jgi:hypothetical protein
MKCIKCGSKLGHLIAKNPLLSVIFDKDGSNLCGCAKCNSTFNYWIGNFESFSISRTTIKVSLKSFINNKLLDVTLPIKYEKYFQQFNGDELIYIIMDKFNNDEIFVHCYTNSSYIKNDDITRVYEIDKPSLLTISIWSVIITIVAAIVFFSLLYSHWTGYQHLNSIIRGIANIAFGFFANKFIFNFLQKILLPGYQINDNDLNNIRNVVSETDDVLNQMTKSDLEKIITSTNNLIQSTDIKLNENIIKVISNQYKILKSIPEEFTIKDLKNANKELVELQLELRKLLNNKD